MNSEEQNKVNESFSKGVENFSEEDLDKTIAREAEAQKKAGKLGEQFENFKLLWQLLKDYHAGNYKNVPWKLIASIGFAVVYLISPIDVLPDFIPILGFVDDASVFALVVAGFQSDIDAYKAWRNGGNLLP